MQSKEAVVDEAAAGPLRLQGRRDVCAHGRGSRCMRAGIGEREVGRWRRVGSGLDLTRERERERERETECVCKKDGRRACLRSPLGCLAAPPRLYGDRARDSATEQERRVLGWAGLGWGGLPRSGAAQVAGRPGRAPVLPMLLLLLLLPLLLCRRREERCWGGAA